MYIFFIIALLSASQAMADFKDDLPSDYPTQPELNSSVSSQRETKKSKNSSSPAHSSSSVPTNSKSKTTAPEAKQNSSENQGAFGSELGNHDSNAPVHFTGKHGNVSRKTGIMNLVGDAVIVQDDTTLKSNMAQIFSFPGTLPTPGSSRIQRALATGNVRVFKKATASSPEIKATGDETEFLVSERILILKGKAKVWRSNEYLNGDIIKVELNSGDVHVIRPEGTVDPKSANTAFGNKAETNKTTKTNNAGQ